MKQKFKISIMLFLSACFICCSILVGNDSKEKNISDSDNTTVGYRYTVKEYNGNVAVFGFGTTYPIEVLECPVNSLPDEEAQKLSAGIDIETEEELQQIIEAYD